MVSVTLSVCHLELQDGLFEERGIDAAQYRGDSPMASKSFHRGTMSPRARLFRRGRTNFDTSRCNPNKCGFDHRYRFHSGIGNNRRFC